MAQRRLAGPHYVISYVFLIQIFTANSDRYAVVKNVLSKPIITRYIRIHPESWYGHICMRTEFYGCKKGILFYLFVYTIVHSTFIHSFIHSFIRSFVRSFVCSSVRPFVRSFFRSFVRSFIHSFIRLSFLFLKTSQWAGILNL